jgi:hypothetical protein
MQRFLDPEGLKSRGLDHFDARAATFGEVIETMEISPDGKSLRPRSRFARFTNLPELQQMFRAFSDVQTAEMLNLPRPRLESGKPIVVACPMSEEQHDLQQELVERYERLRSQKVDPRVDNALNITTDGRKLATDARMLSPTAPDFLESKVNRLVENVISTWTRTTPTPTRGTQMIFADMGVNPTAWGYSPYDDIIKKLVAHGIPRDQIAAIGDAESDAKKQALFEKVRNGSVRVLIGSTQKMGTGTNVQKRLVALHHLDAPWKPAEVEQREGRILRQGNENEQVAIYRYVTTGSFDSYMWQALETKARFISHYVADALMWPPSSKKQNPAGRTPDDRHITFSRIVELPALSPRWRFDNVRTIVPESSCAGSPVERPTGRGTTPFPRLLRRTARVSAPAAAPCQVHFGNHRGPASGRATWRTHHACRDRRRGGSPGHRTTHTPYSYAQVPPPFHSLAEVPGTLATSRHRAVAVRESCRRIRPLPGTRTRLVASDGCL